MHTVIAPIEYPHSHITVRLRGEVIESELRVNVDLAYMTAIAAIHAHPNAEFEKGGAQVNRMFFNALNHIPYLTGGKSGEDMAHDDRQKAIEKYKKMKLQPRSGLEVKDT